MKIVSSGGVEERLFDSNALHQKEFVIFQKKPLLRSMQHVSNSPYIITDSTRHNRLGIPFAHLVIDMQSPENAQSGRP